MGGIGSGNWYRWNTRTTTSNPHSVDIRYLKNAGLLKVGVNGTLSWKVNGENDGWINFQVSNDSLRLIYRHRKNGSEWQDADEQITFDWTTCNYGGRRQWLLCPDCGKRVAILYSLDSGFLCRHCYSLPYASQSETSIDRLMRKRQKISEKLEVVNGYGKPKGMHWKTYYRLRAKEARLNNMTDGLLSKLFSRENH